MKNSLSRMIAPVLVTLVGIVTSTAVGAQEARLSSDLNLLSVILQAATTDAGRADLRIDPRPMNADAGNLTAISEAMLRLPAAVLSRRVAVIRAAGLRTIDATHVGREEGCLGTFVIGSPDARGVSHAHDDCPSKQFATLVIGLPRPEVDCKGFVEPNAGSSQPVAEGQWVSRVIRTTFAPTGSTVYAADYVLARRSGKWNVVKIVGLLFGD